MARETGCQITRTKLAKLLYFADLAAVEEGQSPFTGATWRWRDHGPYDNSLIRVEESLAENSAVSIFDAREWAYGGVTLKLAAEIADPLPAHEMGLIRRIVIEHGAKTATALRDLSYKTSPMVEAQAGGEREVLLDLNRVRRAKQVQALRQRYSQRRSQRPVQERDALVGDALRQEIREMQDYRHRANGKALREN